MKKNIAVIYGGFSAEYQISVLSGKYVSSVIDNQKFNVFDICIDKEKWTVVNNGNTVNKEDFSFIFNEKKIKIDLAVIVIHGNPGENGILQSYFDLINIPYTSCNALTSALTFNKFFCNNYLKAHNVKVAKSIVIRKKEQYEKQLTDFINQVGYPVFIKPNEGGSSFATYKIKKQEDINEAISNAFEHFKEVMVEEFIQGGELTCGVVKTQNQIKALTPCEIVSKNDFFDYDAKYNSTINQEIMPAGFENKIIEKCKNISCEIYKNLNCKGIVRIDYIVKNNELYFLELNSIPGMTSESIVPKMLKYDNINITDLFTEFITEALQ